jgi:hypothetical protein
MGTDMNKYLEQFALVSGGLGFLIAAVAGAGRLAGFRHLLGFESLTLLVAATALMAACCMVQLHLLRTR